MFKFFHLCNHEVQARRKEPVHRELEIKNDGDDIDVLFHGGIVVGIKSVRALTYRDRITRDVFEYDNTYDDHRYEDEDEEDGYYDGAENYYVNYADFFPDGAAVSDPLPTHFFDSYLHNRIKWAVEPPLTYLVEADVLFSNRKKESYNMADCPQCQGNGWFVDILSSAGRFELDEGVMKIAQRVIKDLLTEVQSSVLNLQYGTLIKQTVSASSRDDEEIFDDIRLIVSEVEDRYLLRQQLEYNRLARNERMVRLRIRNISRSPRNVRKIIMELQIETEEEERTFRFSI